MSDPKPSKLEQFKLHYERLDYESPLIEILVKLTLGAKRKLRDRVHIPK